MPAAASLTSSTKIMLSKCSDGAQTSHMHGHSRAILGDLRWTCNDAALLLGDHVGRQRLSIVGDEESDWTQNIVGNNALR